MAYLPKQYTLDSLIEDHHSKKAKLHCLSISKLTNKQWYKIKSSIVDFNSWLNKVFPAFNKPHKELSSSFRLVDNFPNYYSFHTVNWKNTKVKNAYIYLLNKIYDDFISDLNTVLVISDASVKNQVTTSILHIHQGWNIIAKTIYHTISITFTEIELFSIRYGVNQAVQVSNAKNIIIITNTIYTTK